MTIGVDDLIRELVAMPWTWQRFALSGVLLGRGHKKLITTPGRDTFEGPLRFPITLLSEGDAVRSVEIRLQTYPDPDTLDAAELAEKEDELHLVWVDAVQSATRVLGRPVFDGPSGAHGFPPDQQARWLAQWLLPRGRLLVVQRRELPGGPLVVSILLAPLLA